MTIEWSGLQPEEIETKRAGIRTQMEALLAKQDAHTAAVKAGAETPPAGLTPEETDQLNGLTADLAASEPYANFDPADTLNAAREALTDTPPVVDVPVETTPVEKSAAVPTEEEVNAQILDLEKQLAESNDLLAAARADSVSGLTDTDTDTEDPSTSKVQAAASVRADLQYINRDGEITVVKNNGGLAAAFGDALNGRASATFLKSDRFDPESTPHFTGENDAQDWNLIQDTMRQHEMNGHAAFGCPDGSCADACDNVINDPSEIFCVGGTPYLDRMPSIPAGENCSATYYVATKPVDTTEHNKAILCKVIGEGDDARTVSGWELSDGTFVEQTAENGVPLDKPSQILDIDCYEKRTKVLQGTFANYWIRAKDDMCNRTKVGMALERKLAAMEKALERDAIQQSYDDAVLAGHAYEYDASTSGFDAIIEWMDALACVLPGYIEDWCINPENYTPMWSPGLAKFLRVGQIRSGGRVPSLIQTLTECGLNTAGGFRSSCNLPGDALVPTVASWQGTPGEVTTITPGSIQTHALWLVDFSQMPKLVGPSRRISDDQSASAASKNARYVQFEDFMCPLPIGPTPVIPLNVKACNNGTTVGTADFTCVEKPEGEG